MRLSYDLFEEEVMDGIMIVQEFWLSAFSKETKTANISKLIRKKLITG